VLNSPDKSATFFKSHPQPSARGRVLLGERVYVGLSRLSLTLRLLRLQLCTVARPFRVASRCGRSCSFAGVDAGVVWYVVASSADTCASRTIGDATIINMSSRHRRNRKERNVFTRCRTAARLLLSRLSPSELQALPSIYSWLLLLADMLAEYVSKAINNAGINISGNEEERIESLFN